MMERLSLDPKMVQSIAAKAERDDQKNMSVEFMDRSKPLGERIASFSRHMTSRKASEKRVSASISCAPCMDTSFLWVEYEWIMDGDIPQDFDPQWYTRANKFGRGNPGLGGRYPRVYEHDVQPMVAVPCDCHGGTMTCPNTGKEINVQRFFEIFGRAVRDHHYGKAIMRYQQQRREAEYQQKFDADDQAWEVDHSLGAYDLEGVV